MRLGKLSIELGPVCDRGAFWRDWQNRTLAGLVFVALCAGLTLPKDHTVSRLGQGCYYSVMNAGPANVQRETCM